MYEKDFPLYVVYEQNNTAYNCHVIDTKTEENTVKIHYEGFDPKQDEWIECNSKRIIKRTDGITDETRISLGNLMRVSGRITENVISAYNPRENVPKNEKNISALNSTTLMACAESLSIKTKDGGSKLTKAALAKEIVKKIIISLPRTCLECREEFKTNTGSEPPFTCYLCKNESHDCDQIREFKTSLSTMKTLKSFVWLCEKCYQCPTSPQTVTDPPPRKSPRKKRTIPLPKNQLQLQGT